jgi:hypothetical protein
MCRGLSDTEVLTRPGNRRVDYVLRTRGGDNGGKTSKPMDLATAASMLPRLRVRSEEYGCEVDLARVDGDGYVVVIHGGRDEGLD